MSVESARRAVRAARLATENTLMEAMREDKERAALYGETSGIQDKATETADRMRDRMRSI